MSRNRGLRRTSRKAQRRGLAFPSLVVAVVGLLLLPSYIIWGDRFAFAVWPGNFAADVFEGLHPPMGQPWLGIVLFLEASFLLAGPIAIVIALIAFVRRDGGPRYLSVPAFLIGLILCLFTFIFLTTPSGL